MKRAPGLVEISRRHFCGLAGFAGFAVIGGVAACTDGGTGAVQTGALGTDEPPDASTHTTTDAGVTTHDGGVTTHDGGSTGATCTGSPTDVGAASTFALNTPVYVSSGGFFVVRDSGGLYALTAKCTHEGATCVVQSGEFYCPRHGAEFTYNGVVTKGPASSPLKHYSMCTMANGHIGVDTATTVAATVRLDA
jgi:cytochrome b6-f complex iron-sulfur subunit